MTSVTLLVFSASPDRSVGRCIYRESANASLLHQTLAWPTCTDGHVRSRPTFVQKTRGLSLVIVKICSFGPVLGEAHGKSAERLAECHPQGVGNPRVVVNEGGRRVTLGVGRRGADVGVVARVRNQAYPVECFAFMLQKARAGIVYRAYRSYQGAVLEDGLVRIRGGGKAAYGSLPTATARSMARDC